MLTKKSRKNPILMEARKVLLNQVTLDKDDYFVTVQQFRFQLWGAADGEASLRFWGVSRRHFIYEASQDNTKALYRAEKGITTLGRGIRYNVDKQVVGCIVRTYVFYPVVLAFYENEEGNLELSAFTPRWLTSGMAIKAVVRRFDKVMEGSAERQKSEKVSLAERIRNHKEEKRKEKEKRKEEKFEKKKEDFLAKTKKLNGKNLMKEAEESDDKDKKNKASSEDKDDKSLEEQIKEIADNTEDDASSDSYDEEAIQDILSIDWDSDNPVFGDSEDESSDSGKSGKNKKSGKSKKGAASEGTKKSGGASLPTNKRNYK